MRYHISQNGQTTGPFCQEEVYRRLAAGELSGSDLGWHEGLTDWRPLMELLPPSQTPAMPGGPAPVFAAASSPTNGSQGGAPSQTSTLAITSLVCGIVSLFTVGITAIPAIVTGHMALARIKKALGALGGRGLAIAGLVTAYIGLALMALTIGSTFLLHSLTENVDSAKETRAVSDINAIGLALMSYKFRALQLPTTEQGLLALVERPRLEPIPASWRALMKELPKDPWGHGYQYRSPARKAQKEGYDLYSVGKDGVPETEDDIGNW